MSEDLILANATIVCRDEVMSGNVRVVDGYIAAVDAGGVRTAGAVDVGGDLLLPGLIEMHTDNLERYFLPRPHVLWPAPLASLLGHDAEIVGAGITTVFDAICVGVCDENSKRRQVLPLALEALRTARTSDVLRADHMLHVRCEIADPEVLNLIEPVIDDPLVRLVSVMDHTPGQRQWRDLNKMRQHQKREHWSDEKIEAYVVERQALQRKYARHHRRAIVDRVGRYDVTLASHDDTTEADVEAAVTDGIRIAEFPTTLAAAKAARRGAMKIVMGAPNVVRGRSHCGNVSAIDLAADGLLDGLSSDYAPISLLHAAFILHDRLALSLPEAIAKVSANMAALLGLHDRGEIAVGKRADLIRVQRVGDVPVVRQAWREGQRIL